MEIKLEIPEYKNETGLKYNWENGFEINVTKTDNEVLISANKAGLISLAVQLLTLAQDNAPLGCHFHYDEHNALEKGAANLIIQKV